MQRAVELQLTQPLMDAKTSHSENSYQGDEKKLPESPTEKKLVAISQRNFKAGDIILFLPPREGMSCGQKMICCAQALKKRKHGHQEITHAAIFFGYEKSRGKLIPKIADVTGKGFRIGALKEDQPVLIFRARHPELGKLMVDEVRLVQQQKLRLRWNCCVALGMLSKRVKEESKDPLQISKSTTCSRFAIQIHDRSVATKYEQTLSNEILDERKLSR